MANRNFLASRVFSGHGMPVQLNATIPIGATGAVGTVSSPYVKSVVRKAAGIYQIQFTDNYNSYIFGAAQIMSPPSGSAIDPNAANVGSLYTITTVGNSNWTTAGIPTGVTPAIGVSFVLAAAPSSGTGRVKLVGQSGIMSIELAGSPSLTSAPFVAVSGQQGAIVLVQCLAPQVGAATTQGSALQFVAQDPANGSALRLSFLMNSSSIHA